MPGRHLEIATIVLADDKEARSVYCLAMALYCPLPGQFLAIARQETTRREEAEDRRRKKGREGGREKKIAEERKRLLSLLLFTLHQIV